MSLDQHAFALLIGIVAVSALAAFIYAVVTIKAVAAALMIAVALFVAYAVGRAILETVWPQR